MFTFPTRVAGIPCQCLVLEYYPESPMSYRMGRWGLTPSEPEQFDFCLLDRKGYPAPWLERKLVKDDYYRLRDEYVGQFNYEEAA